MASEIGVQTIQHTNGTDAMTIDSSGRVTRSVLPAFRLGLDANLSLTATGTETTITFDDDDTDNCFVQGGMSLSSGVVTVPIAGIYQFNMNLRINNIGSGYIIGKIVINGDTTDNKETYVITSHPASTYENLTGSDVFKLQANDNVRFTIYVQSDSNYNVSHHSSVSGVFIG